MMSLLVLETDYDGFSLSNQSSSLGFFICCGHLGTSLVIHVVGTLRYSEKALIYKCLIAHSIQVSIMVLRPSDKFLLQLHAEP